MIGLTKRQMDCLYALTRNPRSSYEELGRTLGYAASNLKKRPHELVAGLEERGFVRRHKERARAIEIIRPAPIYIKGHRYRFIPRGE